MVVGTLQRSCQVAVVGGGPGGYLAAIRLGQEGRDVVLVEKEPALGGICLNEGCIPSKALLHAAEVYTATRHASEMGIEVSGVSLDVGRMVAWKDRIVKRLTDGVRTLSEKNGVEVLHGTARFTSPHDLEVLSADGEVVRLSFEEAIVATGSVPARVPGFELDGTRVIGSREALSLTEVPRRLVVVGGGYIGLELGSLFRKLGSEVTLLESAETLLPRLDPEVGQALGRRMRALGVDVRLGVRARGVVQRDPPVVEVERPESGVERLEADVVLVCLGRAPLTEGLGLEAAGLSTDARGFLPVDVALRTARPWIRAIGDVAGPPLLAHKAYREAKVAVESMLGRRAEFDNLVIPAVIYTDPEVAWAGMGEAEARAAGIRPRVGTFPLRASGRALTLAAPDGFVKTIADDATGRILGMIVVGANASELIAEGTLAIEMGAFLDDVAAVIHPHPTLSEGILESVDAALGQAVHVLNPKG